MKKLVLSLAFIGFGTFAMAQQQPQKMPSKWGEDHDAMMQQKRAKHMAEMQTELNLTPAQVSQIQALHAKNQARMEQDRLQMQQQRKVKMELNKKNRQQMDDEMRQILSPEQYQKWQAKKQENMQKRKENFANRKGKNMKKGTYKTQPHPKMQK